MMHDLQDTVELPLSQCRVTFRVVDAIRMPPFAGPAWRGAFGHALKHALCVTGAPECPTCVMYQGCGYAYLFETPRPPATEKMRKYPSVPHPFVLDITTQQTQLLPNAKYELGFTLFGRGTALFSAVAHALEQAGITGFGAARGRFVLERIDQLDLVTNEWVPVWDRDHRGTQLRVTSPLVPPVPGRAKVTLTSPLRLKRNSAIVGAGDFCFDVLFRNLLRRISMLTYFHTDQPLETDFAALVRASENVSLDSADLRWQDLSRYSSRQDRKVKVGGIVGEFTLDGKEIGDFWPYLWLGQYTHAGAATSMGLGCYRIETAADLQNAAGTDEAPSS